jgi:NitT/TauT family transport system substrate-binding protein
MTKKKRILSLVLLVVVLAFWGGRAGEEKKSRNLPLKVSLATEKFVSSVLIAVAEDKGFFRDAGLDVDVQSCPSGFVALKKLAQGQVQMATGADFAFLSTLPENPSQVIVATIATVDSFEMITRKNTGITSPTDLRGKKIGVTFGTAGEYYLATCLLANGISPFVRTEVTLVDIRPEKVAAALAEGQVDAVVTWDKYVDETTRLLGDQAVSWSVQNGQDYYWNLVVPGDQADSEAVDRMIRALRKAEGYVVLHKQEAQRIVMGRWNLDEGLVRNFWNRCSLSVGLDQSLVISLENGAAWQLRAQGKTTQALPNVLAYIAKDALEKLDPKAVTIFR